MDFIDNYIRRKNNEEKIEYIDKSLEPILKPTYGIIIYQEQIMQIARTFANYTLGEADLLRRAISKKNENLLLDEKSKFIENSINNGYSKEKAEQIYNLILRFADYGYNKSHSVGYATFACKMAFLKMHFFKYFEIAILNTLIGNPEKTQTHLSEIRKRNIKILPPNINESNTTYKIIDNTIYCPLTIIEKVGSIAEKIIEERKKSPYKSFIDFMLRIYSNLTTKKVLTNLIKAGCFNSFNINELTLINNLDNIITYIELVKDAGEMELVQPTLIMYPNYKKEEIIDNQLEVFGFYLNNHPASMYRKTNDLDTRNIKANFSKNITLILSIDYIKNITTKKNDPMCFVTASDEYGKTSLTLFPNIYKEHMNIEKKDIIEITGRVERRYNEYQIIVNELKILEHKDKK